TSRSSAWTATTTCCSFVVPCPAPTAASSWSGRPTRKTCPSAARPAPQSGRTRRSKPEPGAGKGQRGRKGPIGFGPFRPLCPFPPPGPVSATMDAGVPVLSAGLFPRATMSDGAGKIVGIDLGTTFSAIATLDDHGQAVTLPNRDGELLTPSAVFVDDGYAVVGQAALDVALEQPDKVAALIKRRMGHPGYGRPVSGREFRPESLAAVVLRKLVQDAELRLG